MTDNKKPKRKVAIFDIDGTIFRSSLLIETVEALIQTKVFPSNVESMYEKAHKDWLDRKGTYEDYIGAVIKAFTTHIKGVSYSDFMDVVDEMVELNKNKVYTFTRDLIKELKTKNYYLLAISQSPKSVLDKFCKLLGFDKVYGRIYELGPEDKFTGNISELHLIENKANIVKRAIEKENLTLSGSVGVGDTEGDIPMLEMVQKPICFNPNMKLYKHAKIQKWKIIVERKDVVYLIK